MNIKCIQILEFIGIGSLLAFFSVSGSLIHAASSLSIREVLELSYQSGENGEFRIESSKDFVTWKPSTTWQKGSLENSIFYLEKAHSKEFFRAVTKHAIMDKPTIEGAFIYPEFDPYISNYTVYMDEPSGEVKMEFHADSESASLVVGDNPELRTYRDNAANLLEKRYLKVRLISEEDDVRDMEYVFNFVPSNFPVMDSEFHASKVSSGNILTTIRTKPTSFLIVFNNYGVPVYYKEVQGDAIDLKRHNSDLYSYQVRDTDKRNEFNRKLGKRVLTDKYFNEIRRIGTIDLSHTDGHDFLLLSNGNYLFMSYHGRLLEDTLVVLDPPNFLEDTVIQEVNPSGEVVFQWSTADFVSTAESNFFSPTDYAHGNSLFEDQDGNIIISFRGISQIMKVNRQTGEVMWKLGGDRGTMQIVNDPLTQFCGQHTATRLKNGNLLVFDNGQWCAPNNDSHPSITRVLEYSLDFENHVAELVWEYTRSGFYSTSNGGCFRLENGNTIIAWGRGTNKLLSEIDSHGNLLLDMGAANRQETALTTYRAYRIPPEH